MEHERLTSNDKLQIVNNKSCAGHLKQNAGRQSDMGGGNIAGAGEHAGSIQQHRYACVQAFQKR